jgi:polysaccharide deacetylase family protein (PEP-CTERM system associated)
MITNVLSVDVEEYYHGAIFRAGACARMAGPLESRVERSVDRLLALLREHYTRATFFVLGEVAAEHPSVVRKIAADGHEVASHGDRHEDVYRQSPEEFRADIRRAKARIEDVIGDPVIGYRAPNFSIGRAQAWAFDLLLEEGFRYDSSTYPILHDRYGQLSAPRFPYEIWSNGLSSLVEFPIGTAQVLGMNLPIGGGGYFRLAPLPLFRWGIDRVNSREQQPVMFYLHPWEMDPGQPRPPMPWRHQFRHYVGIDRHEHKLDLLLAHFRFGTARDVLEYSWRPAMAPLPPASLGAPTDTQRLLA